MVLATRCPHCETVFRVHDTQLERSRGLVRCGHCREIFDASQNLLDPSAATVPGTATPAESEPAPHASAAAPAAEARNALPAEFAADSTAADASLRHPVMQPSHPRQAEPSLADQPLHGAEEPAVPAAGLPETHETPEMTPTPVERGEPATEPPISDRAHDSTPLSPPSMFEPTATGDVLEPTLSTRAVPPREAPAERDAAQSPVPHTPIASDASIGRDNEPTLSFGDTSATAWRTDHEPRLNVPPAHDIGTQPAARPTAFDMPPPPPADNRVHFALTRERRSNVPRRGVWRVAGIFIGSLLIVLLVTQLAWWRRETVMVYWPASQPLFASVCARFGCHISPPRDIDGLQVEASDLRQIDGPHRLELRVPLRNHYKVALAYPAIELTLFDERNEVAIRRVLWPQDYAPAGTAIAAGLPPRSTQTMIVRLDSGSVTATNFRVQIFYP